jgi:hypothetical protein
MYDYVKQDRRLREKWAQYEYDAWLNQSLVDLATSGPAWWKEKGNIEERLRQDGIVFDEQNFKLVELYPAPSQLNSLVEDEPYDDLSERLDREEATVNEEE